MTKTKHTETVGGDERCEIPIEPEVYDEADIHPGDKVDIVAYDGVIQVKRRDDDVVLSGDDE